MTDSLRNFLAKARSLTVLSGAGVSTGSGIPDYRDRNGDWKHSQPIQFGDFMANASARCLRILFRQPRNQRLGRLVEHEPQHQAPPAHVLNDRVPVAQGVQAVEQLLAACCGVVGQFGFDEIIRDRTTFVKSVEIKYNAFKGTTAPYFSRRFAKGRHHPVTGSQMSNGPQLGCLLTLHGCKGADAALALKI